MTQIEFMGQFRRLIETFGSKAFPEERNRLIWKHLCDMDAGWFERLANNMIGDMRHAPLLKDFREAAVKERSANRNAQMIQNLPTWENFDPTAGPGCYDCGDEGYIETWKLPAKVYSRRFRCICARGGNQPNLALWEPRFGQFYEFEPWGYPTSSNQATAIRRDWRALFAKDSNDLNAVIGWDRTRSEQDQRQIAQDILTNHSPKETP